MTTRYSHFLFADAITHEIIAPIETGGTVQNTRKEYDINTIASRVLEYDGHGFVLKVDTEKFWDIVQEHAWANILARTLQKKQTAHQWHQEALENAATTPTPPAHTKNPSLSTSKPSTRNSPATKPSAKAAGKTTKTSTTSS